MAEVGKWLTKYRPIWPITAVNRITVLHITELSISLPQADHPRSRMFDANPTDCRQYFEIIAKIKPTVANSASYPQRASVS